jgi:class 3 adenylate cyclase/tetratricopeptide (TPR) repeat protein
MSLNAASKEKPVQNFLTSLIEAYPDASMRDIAVLFTDVVGSTTFFKTHGDIRGREMLRTHHHMAMSIVEEYGGSLIKEVGDSVLVYFPDPVEALKAAMKMQQRFLLHNRESSPEDEIHVRIGLHHGKVIVEEKDIYGDVVNVAAKLTNLAGGDQIFVSHEVYESTRENPLVRFERIDFWNMKNVPDGLSIYKVIWEVAEVPAPSRRVIMVLVPDPLHPEIRGIVDAADLCRGEKDDPSEDECLSIKRSQEDKPVFTYATAPAALKASKRVLSRLAERGAAPQDAVLPVKIFITGVSAREEEEILTNGPTTDLDALPYGAVYVSAEVHQHMRSPYRAEVALAVTFEPAGRLFRVSDSEPALAAPEAPQSEGPGASPQGVHAPCFHCGSTHHKVVHCPSRELTDAGKSIGHLGYLPMQTIEALGTSLERSLADIQVSPGLSPADGAPDGQELAVLAFFDIRWTYQLRFLRVLWNNSAESWDSIRSAVTENEGGFAWLAQDSLRVSSYDKARSFLKLALERKPQDYKACCVSGLLNMELGDVPAAIADFRKALESAKTNVHKIYASLILARLYKLSGDAMRFRHMLGEIGRLDAGCREAIYEDILFKLEEKDEKGAMKKLVKLVRDNPDLFVTVLIDPELAPHRNTIYAHLTELMAEAKNDAISHLDDARKELNRCRALLPLSALKTIEPALQEIEISIHSESYLGCLDVPHRCASIRVMCKNAIDEQSRAIAETMKDLRIRLNNADAFLNAYRYSHLAERHRKRLAYLRRSMERMGDVRYFESSGEFESCHQMCSEISDQLSSIEKRLEVLDLSANLIRMCLKFLKYSSILFSIVFFFGIFIFPLLSEQVNTVLARMDISVFSSAWSLQKAFLIFGGITSLVAAFLITIRQVLTGEK